MSDGKTLPVQFVDHSYIETKLRPPERTALCNVIMTRTSFVLKL